MTITASSTAFFLFHMLHLTCTHVYDEKKFTLADLGIVPPLHFRCISWIRFHWVTGVIIGALTEGQE
ncbi:hypothetical protein A7U60_g913 [Sanghuangporus baumii]|uniref:Secreted protein n=1 Tax=Sanghuangporus baumii TaxID=108892 RepID=A0A9Q5N9N9_SANBA|nr:hypothetical protein A7U60_g913 [Sanghuangporus baumii]